MRPLVLTVTGPSASGKSTLERLLDERNLFNRAISTTTRQKRDKEECGEDYYFVDPEEFEARIANNIFIEYVIFGGNYYGVSVSEVLASATINVPTVIVVEPNGVQQIARQCEIRGWDHLSVFLTHDPQVLLSRFLSRQEITRENTEAIFNRIAGMGDEITEWKKQFDWDLVCDHFCEDTQDELVNSITALAALLRFEAA